jgi:hypothetical protein
LCKRAGSNDIFEREETRYAKLWPLPVSAPQGRCRYRAAEQRHEFAGWIENAFDILQQGAKLQISGDAT